MAVGTYALTSLANLKAWIGVNDHAFDLQLEAAIDRSTSIVESYLDRNVLSRTYYEWIDAYSQRTIAVQHHPITDIKTIAFGTADAIHLTLDNSDDVLATVENDGSSLKFARVDSSGSSSSSSLAFSTYPTTSQLVTQINAAVTGFTASLTKNAYSYTLHRFGGRGMVEANMNLTHARDNISEHRVEFETGRVHLLSDRFPNYRADDRFTHRFPGTFQGLFIEYTAGYSTVPADIEQVAIEIAAELYRLRLEDTSKNSESLGDYSYSRVSSDEKQNMTLSKLLMYRNLR